MPTSGAPDPPEDVKIHWVEMKSTIGFGAREVRDEETTERAEVYAIDLHTTDVESALGWAEQFRAGLTPNDPRPCLVAYGREIKPDEQEQFAMAGIHAIDLFRKDLGLKGPSRAMLARLIRSLVTAHPISAAKPALSQPGPSSGEWQSYYSHPSHVPSSALTGLFEELSRDDRPWWDQDS